MIAVLFKQLESLFGAFRMGHPESVVFKHIGDYHSQVGVIVYNKYLSFHKLSPHDQNQVQYTYYYTSKRNKCQH